ncbi:hypothetical protein [Spiroplasma endosymbiont of Othius punctulatus]|uniref:hypothetical protein n=1 Tax=Spiroplasma endosymbiont of Othius punctulatus TaxID=3066289 RepID=UPI0030D56EBF
MNKNFISVLDIKAKSANVNEHLSADLEFVLNYLLSNSTILTFCNMISFDLYGMDFKQLTTVNNIAIHKSSKDKSLNLTYLEIVYNLIYQMHKRKFKYPDSLGYDMFSTPKKIKSYIELNGYELDPSTNNEGYKLFKLVPSQSKQLIESVIKKSKNEIINIEVKNFISYSQNQFIERVTSLKNIITAKREISDFQVEMFGVEFVKNFLTDIERLSGINLNNISKNDEVFITEHIDRLFYITILLILLSK